MHAALQQPNIGGEVVPHQDSTFLFTDPPSVIGLWFALEDATIENGCLFTLPGSHKPGVHRRMRAAPEGGVTFDKDPAQYNLDHFVPVEVGRPCHGVVYGKCSCVYACAQGFRRWCNERLQECDASGCQAEVQEKTRLPVHGACAAYDLHGKL